MSLKREYNFLCAVHKCSPKTAQTILIVDGNRFMSVPVNAHGELRFHKLAKVPVAHFKQVGKISGAHIKNTLLRTCGAKKSSVFCIPTHVSPVIIIARGN